MTMLRRALAVFALVGVFVFSVQPVKAQTQDQSALIQSLTQQIATLQAQLRAITSTANTSSVSSVAVDHDVYYGVTNDSEVTDLQQILKTDGYFTLDPTGNFYNATLQAVKAFQTARGISPTGYVGPQTRAAISADVTPIIDDNGQAIIPTGSSLSPSNPTLTPVSAGNPVITNTSGCSISSFTASPASVNAGGTTNLQYSANGCLTMMLSGGEFSSRLVPVNSGLISTLPINSATTYTLTGSSATGPVSKPVTVNIGAVATTNPNPNCNISSFAASPSSVTSGQTAYLTYTASGCSTLQITGGQYTGSYIPGNTSSSLTTVPLTTSTTYTLSGVDLNGIKTVKTATVSVSSAGTSSGTGSGTGTTPPASGSGQTVFLTASPSTVYGTSGVSTTSLLSWVALNATSCSAPWTSSTVTNSSQLFGGGVSVVPAQTTTYSITCTGPNGPSTGSATVSYGNPVIPSGGAGIVVQAGIGYPPVDQPAAYAMSRASVGWTITSGSHGTIIGNATDAPYNGSYGYYAPGGCDVYTFNPGPLSGYTPHVSYTYTGVAASNPTAATNSNTANHCSYDPQNLRFTVIYTN